MHCVLFQEFIEIILKFSADLGVRNESTVKNGIFPCRRFETHFFILSRVQREEFHYDKAISYKSYVQLLIQDVYSISSKTCQLEVQAFCRLFSGVARIFC